MGPQTISPPKWNCYGCHIIILKLNHFTTKIKQLNNNSTNLSQETVSNFTTKMKLPSMQEHYPNIRCRNTIQTSRRLSPTTHWRCMLKSPVHVSSNSDMCYWFRENGRTDSTSRGLSTYERKHPDSQTVSESRSWNRDDMRTSSQVDERMDEIKHLTEHHPGVLLKTSQVYKKNRTHIKQTLFFAHSLLKLLIATGVA